MRKIFGYSAGILMILTGLYCLLFPDVPYSTLGIVIGISMLFDAIGQIGVWFELRKAGVKDFWMLAGGIISAVFAVIIITNAGAQQTVNVAVAYIASTWVLIRGILSIYFSLQIHSFREEYELVYVGKYWWHLLVFGIIDCTFGILCLMNPSMMATYLGIMIGIGIISTGCDVITATNIFR